MDAERALDVLYRAHRDAVFAFLYHLCRHQQEAEDLMQETFLRAYRQLQRGETLEQPRHWLIRVAYRAATDQFRRARLLRWIPLADAGREPVAPASSDLGDREAIAAVLRQLPRDQCACLLLREYEDMSYAEVAGALGVSIGTVKMRLVRARERFRQLYRSVNGEPSCGQEEGR